MEKQLEMKTSKLNWSSYTLIIFLSFIVSSCQTGNHGKDLKVNNNSELASALSQVKPGDVIVMADGTWNDASIFIDSSGTSSAPITLQAETPGKVMLTGQSSIILGGDYIIIDGLHFKDGYSPSRAVIRFGKDSENVANHCIVRNCVIEDFNKPQRNKSDLWVLFHGRNNELDHCYLAGKSNRGPTIRVDLEGNQSIYNYHKITNNHFGPRPPKGGPSAETIQIGNSFTSMAPSHTLVANNLFDRCNGEVEVISSKTNFNEFRNNVFYKSEGSLVTRHGNYCLLDGNYFIGDENNNNIGGIRLIGSGHTVTNNYFYKLKGENFRSPLAVMNGIPKSPLNRYIQVTDVLVAYNSWIDCISPLQFGVGSNIDQKDVLPASEIRSARPIRTTVANNLIYNSSPNRLPIVAHDKLDGILFKSNYINKQDNEFSNQESLVQNSFELKEIEENIFAPETDLSDLDLYNGFEFDKISLDLFGNSRQENNSPGAILSASSTYPGILDTEKYGPSWYTDSESDSSSNTITLSPANDLNESISKAKPGDIIILNAGVYEINAPLTIDKKIIIKSSNGEDIPQIKYMGEKATPLFEMNPKGDLKLEKIKLSGNKTNYAFASLKENMSSLYNLNVNDCIISDFDFILKAYKYSFSEYISFMGTELMNCNNGIELSEETEDKGEYNAENIFIAECTFMNIDKNVIDYYRGGYDESTVGGNLKIQNCNFTNCGGKEKNGMLINTYGIINVDISGNSFKNNRVKLAARLWGAKNNSHSNNNFSNSGKIIVEENLKLNLLY